MLIGLQLYAEITPVLERERIREGEREREKSRRESESEWKAFLRALRP